MKNFTIIIRIFLATLIAVMAPALIAYAVVQNISGVTGSTQNFISDSNVTMTSSTTANTHALGWSGVLPLSRGGTGTSTFITGSIPFFDGARFTEDKRFKYSDLEWSGGLGEKGLILSSNSAGQNEAVIQGAFGTTSNPNGTNLVITAGWGLTGNGGGINIYGGDAGTNGNSGDIQIGPGQGGSVSGNGGSLVLYSGSANGNGNGGDVTISAGFGSGSGTHGKLKLQSGPGQYAELNTLGLLSSDKTFHFPNITGTFALLQGSATSTIKIGDIKSCIVMADSDGSGVTYVTANDGALTATTTQPTNCQ